MLPSELGHLEFSHHAEERMQEYGLSKEDVLFVMSDPDTRRPSQHGKENLVRTLPDGRRVRVPAVPLPNTHWRIITVIIENKEAGR